MRTTSLYILATPLLLAGCAGMGALPVDKPCGVLSDSLSNVRGRTAKGDQRIAEHFERGVRAGCWTRAGADKLDVGVPALASPQPAVYQKRTTAQRILRRPAKQVVEPQPTATAEDAPAPTEAAPVERVEAPTVIAPAPKKTRWQRFKERLRHPLRRTQAQ